MGATMTAIIEWTHDAQCAARSGLIPSGAARWADDHLHGILFNTDKEYDFFAAIAGVRSRFNVAPLVQPRGLPINLSPPARNWFKQFDDGVVGWLHLSEIDRCLEHMAVRQDSFDFDLQTGLSLMRRIADTLTDPHVRLVFDIERA